MAKWVARIMKCCLTMPNLHCRRMAPRSPCLKVICGICFTNNAPRRRKISQSQGFDLNLWHP
jgi:hypothetical protein